jgi:uncharacterized YigZ family protein
MLKIFCEFQNSLPEQIATVSGFNEFVYKEKSSSFIAQVFRIDSPEHFDEILSNVRRKYFDASHHCFAYRLVNNKIKYSDDGEPHGSAGIRILNAIDHYNLTNVAVVVIRYFGGTKLGVGPLGKAYSNAANLVLEKAEKIKLFLCQRLEVEINFNQINYLHHLVKNFNIIIEESNFSNNAYYKLLIKRELLEKFITSFNNIFNSTSEIIITKEFFYIQL